VARTLDRVADDLGLAMVARGMGQGEEIVSGCRCISPSMDTSSLIGRSPKIRGIIRYLQLCGKWES
jgi:hypothetical protein